ncbi:MAG: PIN domain-containing protein [Chloroflexota bacterium]|nr:MAG: PIN domain-containing protein [Chloroflexota bacterium]
MIAAVLDTNVLASGFVRRNPTSPVVQLLDAWHARLYTLVISEHIIAELARA